MSRSDHTPTNPDDTPAQILSPITQALKDHKLTLNRLCKDLDQTIKTTKKQPIARLKGLDMGFKLQQAYPAEKKELEITGIERLTDQELDDRIVAKMAERDKENIK